ncbi:pentapeptide repeat-containing protein [Candidatus Woesearchaeota archaeon]|nr:pentapeptide repeat-containing protein [Candidatus Woesearchaeota archaeon]
MNNLSRTNLSESYLAYADLIRSNCSGANPSIIFSFI